MCSQGADFADVRECSPASKSLVALEIRSLANGGEHAAQDWGSRGRRFKSCHPDGKQQVRGRFGQNPRRPLCCRVAIGVATAHVLSSPLLLRTAGRRSAPSVETAARRYAVAPPPRACARLNQCHRLCRPTPLFPKPWLPLIARRQVRVSLAQGILGRRRRKERSQVGLPPDFWFKDIGELEWTCERGHGAVRTWRRTPPSALAPPRCAAGKSRRRSE